MTRRASLSLTILALTIVGAITLMIGLRTHSKISVFITLLCLVTLREAFIQLLTSDA
jgi:hypothetical protein